MSTCPFSYTCQFYRATEPSIVKRIKFASAYPYCKGGRHAACVLYPLMQNGADLPPDLLPDGSHGTYRESDGLPAATATGTAPRRREGTRRFLVVENSPVFATLAANVIRVAVPEAEVVQCASYGDATKHLADTPDLIVCGYGLGEERTVHDLRRLTTAPIVLVTGRPGEIDVPTHARLVEKSAGPEALRTAIAAFIG